MNDPFVIAVFTVSMLLAVAWIVLTAVQSIKKRRSLEQEVEEARREQAAQEKTEPEEKQ